MNWDKVFHILSEKSLPQPGRNTIACPQCGADEGHEVRSVNLFQPKPLDDWNDHTFDQIVKLDDSGISLERRKVYTGTGEDPFGLVMTAACPAGHVWHWALRQANGALFETSFADHASLYEGDPEPHDSDEELIDNYSALDDL